jgi:hypothetical protein
MFTWICKIRLPALVAAVMLLAGCLENASLSRLTGRESASGPASVTVLNGAVTVQGPQGYCIDTAATRETATEAFVLLARCTSRNRNTPVLSATVTAIGGFDGTPDLGELSRFLATDAGRGHLSRSGRAGDLAIASLSTEEGTIWLLLDDRGNPAAFEPVYWRAILPAAGRVITLSVLSSRENPVTVETARDVLRAFVAAMRRANAG